jgi:Secretion system C-terminal sorting domain
MKKILISLVIITLFYNTTQAQTSEPSKLEILQHWAPKIYQDVRSDKPFFHQYYEAQDFIVKVDFDGDWESSNSKSNSSIPNGGDYSRMVGHAYTSFVETETHYFLQYGFFHANDDAVLPIDQHNNDYEQVYICVKKNDTKFGKFVALTLNSHGKFYTYFKTQLLFENDHPKIYIPANGDAATNNAVFYNLITLNWLDIDFNLKGHGLTSYKKKYKDKLYIGEDAIIYNVADIGEVPKNTNGMFEESYNYALVDFNELWNRRSFFDGSPFTKYGYFHGDKATLDFDEDWLRNPATLFFNYLSVFSQFAPLDEIDMTNFSQTYVYNPFFNTSEQNPKGAPILPLSDGWKAKYINQNGGRNATPEEVNFHRNTFLINAIQISDNQNIQISDNLLFSYKPLKGNSEISGRVYSVQNNYLNPSTGAGIMIRNSLDASSKFVSIKTDEKKNIVVQYREADGSALKQINGPNTNNFLLTFKITRNDDKFDVYYATKNNNFLRILSIEIDMAADVFAGVLSHAESKDRFCSIVVDKIKTSEFPTPLKEVFVADLTQKINSKNQNFGITIVSDFDKKLLHINTEKTGELKNAMIYIYDMLGQIVLQQKLVDGHNRTIDTSSLKNGAYLIKVINYDGKIMNEKVYL